MRNRRFLPGGQVGTVVIVTILALAVGGLLFGRLTSLSPAQQERQRIETAEWAERAKSERPALTLWAYGWRAVVLTAALGVVTVAVVYGWRRAAEVRPDSAGIFPLIRVKIGKALMLHDPNRTVSAITLYTPAELAQQVSVISISSGDADAQERTTARAQAVQLTAAAHRHPPMLASGKSGQDAQTLPEGETQETVWPWPSRVPLKGLTDGGSSLSRLVLGVTVNQETGQSEVITGNMAKMVHVAIGGSSGWGKSMFLRSIAYQLAMAVEQPDLALIDLENVTFAQFSKSDRLLYPIADTEQDALAVFGALTNELDKRKGMFSDFPGVDSLAAFNTKSDNPLTPIICLTDEATALLADKSVEGALRTLALRGRKFGLWLCLGGQDWKASSLDTAIRNQLSARVQFRAMSASQSRVLLQTRGAESLDVPGRALAVLPGRGLLQFQAPVIGVDDITAALTGDGPRHELPKNVAQDENAEVIRQLDTEGLSPSAIAQQVFGYKNQRTVDKVREILDQ